MNSEVQFVASYLEAALWSACLGDLGVNDFAPEAIARAIADCEAFEAIVKPHYSNYRGNGKPEVMTGHDFWLTRNREGAGFLDGDWGDSGDFLTEAAHRFGEIDLIVGDDGLIYMA